MVPQGSYIQVFIYLTFLIGIVQNALKRERRSSFDHRRYFTILIQQWNSYTNYSSCALLAQKGQNHLFTLEYSI